MTYMDPTSAYQISLLNKLKTLIENLSVGQVDTTPIVNAIKTELDTKLPDARLNSIDGTNMNVANLAGRLTNSWAIQLDLLYQELSSIDFTNLNLLTTDRMSKIDTINTIIASLNTRLSDTWAAKLDTLNTDNTNLKTELDTINTRLSDAWSAKLDNTDSNVTTLLGRLTATWASKLDALRSGLTDARMGYLDLINTLNARLTDVWAAKLDSIRTSLTDTRIGYLDLINTINTRLSDTWSAKLDALRTGLTDQRMSYLDQIPNITSGGSGSSSSLPLPLKVSNRAFTGIAFQTNAAAILVSPLGRTANSYNNAYPRAVKTTTDILNITGRGKLKLFCLNKWFNTAVSGTVTMTARVIIDGVTVIELTNTKTAATINTGYYGSLALVGEPQPIYNSGTREWYPTLPDCIYFSTSLKLQVDVDLTAFSSGAAVSTSVSSYFDYETY